MYSTIRFTCWTAKFTGVWVKRYFSFSASSKRAACLLAQLWEVSTFYCTSVLGIRDWSWSELLLELCIGVEESSIADWDRDCGDIHKRTLSFLWTGRRIRGVRMFSGDVSPKRRVLCESS